jgi:superfamily II DNA helicase RecQ
MSSHYEQAIEKLRDIFGFPGLRGLQDQVIRRLLEDEASAAVVMPTGAGKSLCFQLPALVLPGLTLVVRSSLAVIDQLGPPLRLQVSPLIALMKDQVDSLRKRGIKAAAMDSSQSADDMAATKQAIRDGSLRLLFVAPERLNNEQFVLQMRDVTISLLAVDEVRACTQLSCPSTASPPVALHLVCVACDRMAPLDFRASYSMGSFLPA